MAWSGLRSKLDTINKIGSNYSTPTGSQAGATGINPNSNRLTPAQWQQVLAKKKTDADKAKQDIVDERVWSAKQGVTDPGALDSAMGKQLVDNITQQMGGRESNQLLNAKQSGNEALARKAADIRGAAAQNSILNGQLGQGMAQTGKMQAEMATMQQMGDFQTNMAGLAAQEQQTAQQRALQALGLMQQDTQIAEMKRRGIIADDLNEKEYDQRGQLAAIEMANKMKLSGSAGILMGDLRDSYLNDEQISKEISGDVNSQNLLIEQQAILPFLETMSSKQIDGSYDFENKTWNGKAIDPSTAAAIEQRLLQTPEYSIRFSLKEGDISNLKEDDVIALKNEQSLRNSAGIKDVDKSQDILFSDKKSFIDAGFERGMDPVKFANDYIDKNKSNIYYKGELYTLSDVEQGYTPRQLVYYGVNEDGRRVKIGHSYIL